MHPDEDGRPLQEGHGDSRLPCHADDAHNGSGHPPSGQNRRRTQSHTHLSHHALHAGGQFPGDAGDIGAGRMGQTRPTHRVSHLAEENTLTCAVVAAAMCMQIADHGKALAGVPAVQSCLPLGAQAQRHR